MSGDGYATSPDRSVKQALNCRVSRICANHFGLHTLPAAGVDDGRSADCSFMLVKDNYVRDCLISREVAYFWLTHVLSEFLDNAPSYLGK